MNSIFYQLTHHSSIIHLPSLSVSIQTTGRRRFVLDRFGEYDWSDSWNHQLLLHDVENTALWILASSLCQISRAAKGRLGVLLCQSIRERGYTAISSVEAGWHSYGSKTTRSEKVPWRLLHQWGWWKLHWIAFRDPSVASYRRPLSCRVGAISLHWLWSLNCRSLRVDDRYTQHYSTPKHGIIIIFLL